MRFILTTPTESCAYKYKSGKKAITLITVDQSFGNDLHDPTLQQINDHTTEDFRISIFF